MSETPEATPDPCVTYVGDGDEVGITEEFIGSVLQHAVPRAKQMLEELPDVTVEQLYSMLSRALVIETVHQMAQDGMLIGTDDDDEPEPDEDGEER